MKKYIYILFLLLFSQVAKAQFLVKGQIADNSTQEPLVGATILELDTKNGTVADLQGRFELTVSNQNAKLKIAFLGYDEKIVSISKSQPLKISLESNSTNLNEVVVSGFANEKRYQDVSGGVALVTKQDLKRANSFSLQPSLNLIPGVRVDQSHFSDTRISVRGVGVRSQFGNRNLKFYINGIPLTEADGFTRIEGIDVSTLGKIEVIKGPASSIYGFGTGGVINFQTEKSAYNEQSISSEAMLGSYGLARVSSTYRVGNDKVNATATYGWQQMDGYREWSADTRRFFTSNLQFYVSEKQTVSAFINRTSQDALIPGNLNAEQLAEDRKQASPNNLRQKYGRDQVWTRIGISNNYDFAENFSNNTSIFTSFYDLDHPIFQYLRTAYQSYGGRTQFSYKPKLGNFDLNLTFGGEYLNGLSKATRYVNNEGVEGDLLFNTDQDNTQYSIFAQAESELTKKISLTVGASYNRMEYNVTDYLDTLGVITKDFDPEFTPRVALSYLAHPNHSFHASVSYGFAPPTTSEISDENGNINQAIQPETGVNYELNAKGSFLNRKLTYDVSLFRFNVKDELIAQSIRQNVTIYNNAGETSRNGLELGLYYNAVGKENLTFASVRPFATLTYSDFQFEEYQILNGNDSVIADFSGNDLTGVSPWVFNIGLDLIAKNGLYFYGTYLYTGKAPINDAGTDFNESYGVVNVKAGFQKVFGKIGIDAYLACDNLTNELYSSRIALNATAFGGGAPPYFAPSPERLWFGGLSVKYYFSK